MKKIKRIAILSAAAIMTLSGCGGKKDNNKTSDNTSVVSTTNGDKQSSNNGFGLSREIPILNEDSIQIHYNRKTGDYTGWNLWLWAKGKDGKAYDFNYEDDYGLIASYPLSLFHTSDSLDDIGFIIRKGEWEQKDIESDRFIDFSSYTKDKNGVYHVYIQEGDANIYANENMKVIYSIKGARFTNSDKIFFEANAKMNSYKIYQNDTIVAQGSVTSKTFATIDIDFEIDYGSAYTVEVGFIDSDKTVKSSISKYELFATKEFADLFNYDGELGALYTQEKTTFKVWSPAATKIVLKVYESGTPVEINKNIGSDLCQKYEMTKGKKGVFDYDVNGDLQGKYYTYTAFTKEHPEGVEIVDPYAKSCGINGLRGMIVDFSKTNPDGWEETQIKQYDRKSLVVYETHVVDVSSSLSWGGSQANAKKYLGLIEKGTTLPSDSTIKTGFDHIVDLGVNAIQLQPIFDYQSNEVTPEFNWGYDPLNYNSLEGSYSSNPYDGYERIKEFKQVVKTFADAGINVIMDVVYNHVNAAKGSNFDILCPGYYYRYDSTGNLTNGSGCGNETASEHYMMRKFIKDSTMFWAREYKLGGFRFDLMGCHDIDTMNLVSASLKELNPYITVYGEPWTGGTSGISSSSIPASQAYGSKYVGYGAFNDQMRDALIKGGLSGASEKGWITNTKSVLGTDVTKISNGLKGITNSSIKDPNKVVNYVTCHDNYTLYDRIKAAGIKDEDTIISMAQLANAIVFTSQGTTFMLAGEEMLRTKDGDSNSYKSSYKVNELDYSRLTEPQIKKLYENYKDLIKFKTKNAAMHMEQDDIANNVVVTPKEGNAVIEMAISYEGEEFVIIHGNGMLKENTYSLDIGTSQVLANTTGTTNYLQPYQTLILKK